MSSLKWQFLVICCSYEVVLGLVLFILSSRSWRRHHLENPIKGGSVRRIFRRCNESKRELVKGHFSGNFIRVPQYKYLPIFQLKYTSSNPSKNIPLLNYVGSRT